MGVPVAQIGKGAPGGVVELSDSLALPRPVRFEAMTFAASAWAGANELAHKYDLRVIVVVAEQDATALIRRMALCLAQHIPSQRPVDRERVAIQSL